MYKEEIKEFKIVLKWKGLEGHVLRRVQKGIFFAGVVCTQKKIYNLLCSRICSISAVSLQKMMFN